MAISRAVLRLLLAVILVINSLAGVAMAADMATHIVTANSGETRPREAHDGCPGSVTEAQDRQGGEEASSAGSDCCADGRCACVHHNTAIAALPPLAVVIAWPSMPSSDVTAALGRRLIPDLRPPITPIS
jgi:hypothetical protein